MAIYTRTAFAVLFYTKKIKKLSRLQNLEYKKVHNINIKDSSKILL